MPEFDAVVSNPPFSYRWESGHAAGEDARFKSHGIAPKSAADFAFLLHGLHYLKDDGVMAIILPHGVLFPSAKGDRMDPPRDRVRGGAAVREQRTVELIGTDPYTRPRPETRRSRSLVARSVWTLKR